METIQELEKYLEDECYSFQELSIGKHHAYEGYVVEKDYSGYLFSYSERGYKSILKTFSTEKDLVDYVLEKLNEDEWSKAHLVAWVWNEKDIKRAESELLAMGILFKRNDIPNYTLGKTAFRIFVFGRDVLKLEEFKRKYFMR